MKKKINFIVLLLLIGISPALISLIISTLISISTMTDSLEDGIYKKLNVAAQSLANYYEYDIANGDIEYEEDYVDSLLDQNIELTVFKDNTRFMTSIYKDNSTERNVGTEADANIYSDVKNGAVVQKDKVKIGGKNYYVTYRPMYDGENNFWGMAFAGTPEEDVKSAISATKIKLIIAAVLLILVSGGSVAFISLNIKKPIENTVIALNNLSKGNIHMDIEVVSPINEIENIILAAKDLQSALDNSIGSVKTAAEQLNAAVVDVDDKTANNVESISQINVAMEEVSTTSQTVSSSAVTLTDKAMQLGKDVDELTDNINKLSNSSVEIKDANDEATKYMKSVLDSSSQSVTAVRNIAENIVDTRKAIREIESAVGIIEEISNETKLLSLNASIEAARAGEAGKGFAVVAENIKNLAESSSNNVDKISEIIHKITEIADESVGNAEKVEEIINQEQTYISDTQNKFGILSTNIDSSIKQIDTISKKTIGLNTIKSELTEETESLSAISEELGASAQEVSASCSVVLDGCQDTMARTEEMRAINETLSSAVSFFK